MAYRKIDGNRFWKSPTIRSLSDDARMLCLYLLTSPHTNPLCVYRLPEGYGASDLQWSMDRYREAFRELLEKEKEDGTKGLIAFDPRTELVTVKGQLEKEGIFNPNTAKSCITSLESLPLNSQIFQYVLTVVQRLRKPYTEGLEERLLQHIPNLQEQEQEQEQDPPISPQMRLQETGNAKIGWKASMEKQGKTGLHRKKDNEYAKLGRSKSQ